MKTITSAGSYDIATFIEIWNSGALPKPKQFSRGGRKTKKKRKKNASPIKTRKVKKQNK
jgi:hypothetical protein